MSKVNLKLVEIALERVSGTDFEKFVAAIGPSLLGVDFIPTGGNKDGGADGYQDPGLFESRRPGTFYQASIQEDHRAKIRHTISRLREFGRDPKTLVYFTSRPIATPDVEEEALSEETGAVIKLRPRSWVIANLAGSAAADVAFNSYLAPHISFINDVGGAQTLSESPHVKSRSICVFLGQEAERRRKKSTLLESLADSLILWSLDKTDPDAGIFLTRDEILDRILAAFPPAKTFLPGILDNRIKALASKGNTFGREIRWYNKEKKGCLPLETRELIREENIEDEFLRTTVLEAFETSAMKVLSERKAQTPTPALVSKIVMSAVEQAFINNGLELAAFLKFGGSQSTCPPLSDDVDIAIQKHNAKKEDIPLAKEISLVLLRRAFYESTPEQREFFGKLSRTYALLFSLHADARTVEYFQHMSAEFVLFVGTDIFIRALAEQYLPLQDQMTCNLLKILKDAGATLYLCEPVLEEIHRHLETSDWEFANYCAPHEPYIDTNIARHIGKILIRAYFYAKLSPSTEVRPPAGWKSFVGQFCDYDSLHRTAESRRQILKYLVDRFRLEYLSQEDLSELIREKELDDLTLQLMPFKRESGKEVLAQNDAKMILGVYGMRKKRKEEFKGSPYGFATWWLTHETLVQLATPELVKKKGAKYILRPDFVLNFICLSPTTEDVRKAYAEIMPSLLGVQLSNRMREEVFHDTMDKMNAASAIDDSRARVLMGDLSNKLKGDHFKQYEKEWAKQPF